jgi:hypothetical protein
MYDHAGSDPSNLHSDVTYDHAAAHANIFKFDAPVGVSFFPSLLLSLFCFSFLYLYSLHISICLTVTLTLTLTLILILILTLI